jgi:hypothetical protein
MVAIAFEGAHHLEHGLAGRRQNAAHDDVPDLPLRMAADDRDLARRSHCPFLKQCLGLIQINPPTPESAIIITSGRA